jgi:hypothetical protein
VKYLLHKTGTKAAILKPTVVVNTHQNVMHMDHQKESADSTERMQE